MERLIFVRGRPLRAWRTIRAIASSPWTIAIVFVIAYLAIAAAMLTEAST